MTWNSVSGGHTGQQRLPDVDVALADSERGSWPDAAPLAGTSDLLPAESSVRQTLASRPGGMVMVRPPMGVKGRPMPKLAKARSMVTVCVTALVFFTHTQISVG